jgi:hypothetical protein
MNDVLWLLAPGHNGRYEVSERGEVRNARTLQVLKCFPDRDGYMQVSLIVNGRNKTFKVHRLVCEAFHGPAPDGKPEVDHDNRIKFDNRSTNLKWSTELDNRPGRNPGASGHRGVSPHGKGFRAYVSHVGKQISLGSHATIEEAIAARQRYEMENQNV